MANCMNIDTSEPDNQVRARAYWPLIVQVVDDLDSDKPDATRTNIKHFMMHVAWHEGARLKFRVQQPPDPSRPGRSFLQMEPPKTCDGYDFAIQQDFVDRLTSSSGASKADLDTARAAIDGQNLWPAGNLFESLLSNCDLFGLNLARIAFKRMSSPIGATNQDHAQYWADNWKIQFDSPDDKARQIAIFRSEADEVDALLIARGVSDRSESEDCA